MTKHRICRHNIFPSLISWKKKKTLLWFVKFGEVTSNLQAFFPTVKGVERSDRSITNFLLVHQAYVLSITQIWSEYHLPCFILFFVKRTNVWTFNLSMLQIKSPFGIEQILSKCWNYLKNHNVKNTPLNKKVLMVRFHKVHYEWYILFKY